ncbi:squalene--hopene cyclase [Streptomyces sp. NPDC003691]
MMRVKESKKPESRSTKSLSAELTLGRPVMADYSAIISRGIDALLARQQSDGWWYGPMFSNVAMDADDLLLREFLGIRTPEVTEATARWLRDRQSADGSWPHSPGGPGNLSTTIEAYVALRVAGDDSRAPHMERAAHFVREAGGPAASRTGTRFWLALFGLGSWTDVPVMMPEQIFLPKRSPFSMYAFAGWSRIALPPLAIVCAHRPVRNPGFSAAELIPYGAEPRRHRHPRRSVAGLFERTDSVVLQRYQRRPFGPLRRAALRAAEQWLLHHQERDGSWLAVHPVSLFGVLALHTAGYGREHPVMRAALGGLDGFAVPVDTAEGPARRIVACPGKVWDTALSVLALLDAGVPADRPAVRTAVDRLLDSEVRTRGDWAVPRPALEPGAWSFAPELTHYPDTDDTAAVLLALHRSARETGPAAAGGAEPPGAEPAGRVTAALGRGTGWLLGMQSDAGGWATYDPGNVPALSRAVSRLPFCDYGPVIDPPWGGDLTGHVLETMGELGLSGDPRVRRGVDWLLAEQAPSGAWYGRWGVHYLYGTGAAVPALVACGVAPGSEPVRRAVRWLTEHQNPDGGWGEDCRAYDAPEHHGRGDSTPSQTAWALLALHAARIPAGDERVRRGLDWLTEHQLDDGDWAEDVHTGVGHPGELFFGYPLYRLVFPLMAMGRYVHRPPAAE